MKVWIVWNRNLKVDLVFGVLQPRQTSELLLGDRSFLSRPPTGLSAGFDGLIGVLVQRV